MNNNFKTYQKALKQNRPFADDLETVDKRPSVGGPSVLDRLLNHEQTAGPAAVENNGTVGDSDLSRLESRDSSLRQKMIAELEKEIEEYRQARAEKKAAQERQIQAENQQQQAENKQSRPLSAPDSKPKRGSAFLGLGGKKKQTAQIQVNRTRQEMSANKSAG